MVGGIATVSSGPLEFGMGNSRSRHSDGRPNELQRYLGSLTAFTVYIQVHDGDQIWVLRDRSQTSVAMKISVSVR